ncbi:hypothetical protein [Streptomyces olivochromogenes]|uniref:hypothetical protein n=1 Tax=Streptomyces olivochromogenes TaxID=1963 RepID=UPI001F2A2185|nr:hypothetical protein [Streptomyces olivochromogenes]MCF3136621.1 hypothetical protein [Streptomyces olivochromogenes]
MQGHGYAQPVKQPPDTAVLVFLRILFVVIGFLCIGFAAWAMLLRLAIVTRKPLDWCLFIVALAADIISVVLIGSDPADEVSTGGAVGLGILFGTLVVVTVYYLAADIRHFARQREAYRAQQPMARAYNYPGPVSPYTATTVPSTPVAPMPLTPHTPPPGPPISTSHQRPAPARIDQVRAELDELSDYLRKHDGHPEDNHEGGR